eukprot:802449_1
MTNTIFWLLQLSIPTVITMTWSISTTPITDFGTVANAFIAYHNHTIQIIGGSGTENNIITFPLDLSSITTITTDTYFGEGSSIQIDDRLWMFPDYMMQLNVFDLDQQTITDTIPFPGTGARNRCVTNYDDYIMVLGGQTKYWMAHQTNYLTDFWIYNRTNESWFTGQSLRSARMYHSCDVVGDELFVVGGSYGDPREYLDSVEYLNISASFTDTWSTISDVLSTPKIRHRSVVFESNIYVIGGLYYVINGHYVDQVDIIDTVSKTISSPSTNQLVYAKAGVSAVFVNGFVYCFGGSPSSTSEYYQYAAIIPTRSPSNAPTTSPTKPPTNSPTILSDSPSNAPSNTPTMPPTNAPTIAPSTHPTIYPSNSPFNAPTNAPTHTPSTPPSNAPSNTPSNAPTNAPSVAPTRYPTARNEYNKTLDIVFRIWNLTTENVLFVHNKDEIKFHIIPLIETAYINVPVGEKYLEYRQFEIDINSFNYNQEMITINSSVNYKDDEVKRDLIWLSDTKQFEDTSESMLRDYYQSKYVLFEANVIEKEEASQTTVDHVFYSILAFICLMGFGSLIAFVYNKKGGTKTDDADWLILLFVGLQITDFFSDILLSNEIINEFGSSYGEKTLLLHITGFGSILFILLPYVINIYIAFKIEKYIQDNKAASMHFKAYRSLFVFIMLVTGSSYIALLLLSSRLFALDVFNSGLSRYELRQLSTLKVYASVLTEDMPQIAIQILYAFYQGGNVSDVAVLSFTMSLLSIIAAILFYLMQRTSSNSMVVKYQIDFVKSCSLSNEEKKQLIQKKECKEALRKSLCAALKIEDTLLEFGYITPSNNGAIINVVHFIFYTELQNKTATSIIMDLYDLQQKEVQDSLSQHFEFIGCVSIDSLKPYYREMKSLDGRTTTSTDVSALQHNIDDIIHHIQRLSMRGMKNNDIEKTLIKDGYNKQLIVVLLNQYDDESESSNDDENDHETVSLSIGIFAQKSTEL